MSYRSSIIAGQRHVRRALRRLPRATRRVIGPVITGQTVHLGQTSVEVMVLIALLAVGAITVLGIVTGALTAYANELAIWLGAHKPV